MMRTVELYPADRATAARLCSEWECPAIAAFVTEWEMSGSCRFIGLDAQDEEVSVLLVAEGRPEFALPPPG